MGSSEKSGASTPITSQHSKMINVILYILAKCAGKPNMGKIVLNKLLYFIDFNFHEKYHESLTGESYIKMPMGPVPQDIEDIIVTMKEHGMVDQVEGEYFGYTQVRLIPKAEPDLKALNGEELAEIEYVINQYGDKTGKRLTDFSHGDTPWRVTPKIGDKISYGLAHYRE